MSDVEISKEDSKRVGEEELDKFIDSNDVDENAAKDLRGCPVEVQKIVLSRGDLSSARNPSAALIARIRDARTSVTSGHHVPGDKGSSSGDPKTAAEVEEFIKANKIDDSAAASLRGNSLDVQKAVIARGELTGARNPSSALLSRIRDAKSAPAGGAMVVAGPHGYSYGMPMGAMPPPPGGYGYGGYAMPPPPPGYPNGYAMQQQQAQAAYYAQMYGYPYGAYPGMPPGYPPPPGADYGPYGAPPGGKNRSRSRSRGHSRSRRRSRSCSASPAEQSSSGGSSSSSRSCSKAKTRRGKAAAKSRQRGGRRKKRAKSSSPILKKRAKSSSPILKKRAKSCSASPSKDRAKSSSPSPPRKRKRR